MEIREVCLLVGLLFLAPLILSAETKKKEGDFAAIMAEKQRAKHVLAWRRYSFLGIPLVAEGPRIDGKLNEREWRQGAGIGYLLHMAEGMQVPDATRWFICYTKSHLFLGFQYERPENARAPSARDFFELLFDVTHGHRRYYNFAANMEKKLWGAIGPHVDKQAPPLEWAYKTRRTESGWEGEISIPFTSIKGLKEAPPPGTLWGADFVRNERTPSDRLAFWSWRSNWHAVKDLGHLLFTGKPLAIQTESIGWMPEVKKMGVRLAVANFGDEPVELTSRQEIRRAKKELAMEYLPALDSALTEDLDAAIGTDVQKEIARELDHFDLRKLVLQKITVPARATRQVALTLPDQPGNYLVSFSLKKGDQLLAGMTDPYKVTVPLNLSLKSYLYSAGLVACKVDLRRVQEKLAPDSVLKLSARTGKETRPVASSILRPVQGKEQVEAELHFLPTPGATYQFTAVLKKGDQEIASNSAPLVVPPKPKWIGSQVGRSKFVPPPFVPLKATPNSCEILTIRYDWPSGSVFPGVKVKGNDILAAPLSLRFRAGSGKATPMELKSFGLKSRDIERAEYAFEGELAGLGTLRGTAAVEFDGFLWYDFFLEPKQGARLSGCTFTATLRKEYARIHTLGRIPAGVGDLVPKVDAVGGIPPGGLAYPYTFQTWLGYVEGGLQWYCENARNWFNKEPERAIQIRPEKDRVSLVVHFVDRQVPLKQEMDWHFGLMPTPARVPVGGAEQHAYYQMGGIPSGFEYPDKALKKGDPKKYQERLRSAELLNHKLKENGVKAVILFSSYNDIFGYPGIRDPERKQRLHRFVKAMHKQGIRVLVYNGWGISTKCDEWEQFGSELVNLPLKNSGYSTYWPSPVSLFPDLFVYRMAEHIREFDLDGIYMDSTTAISFSRHPNGMRWTDEKGRLRGSYPVRAMRDFTKRLYKVLNGEVIKGGIYYNHHSPQADVCVENFTTVRCPSEFAQSYDGEFDRDFVDYFLAKNGGIQYGYHAELTNKNWMKRIHKSINEINAIAVPLGVSFKSVTFAHWIKSDYSRMAQPMYRIWKAMSWLGSESALYLPWWKNRDYLSTNPADGVLTAVWLKKGNKALVCVTNLPEKDRDIEVTLNLKQMGFSDVKIEDAILGTPVPLNGNRVMLKIEEERWRLWKVMPKE